MKSMMPHGIMGLERVNCTELHQVLLKTENTIIFSKTMYFTCLSQRRKGHYRLLPKKFRCDVSVHGRTPAPLVLYKEMS